MSGDGGRCLLFVHAHPDDECLSTGGTIARYGHPDHVRAHDVAMRAVKSAAPEHTVRKVYFTAVPKSLLIGGRDLAKQFDQSPDDFFSLEEIERIGTDDEAITTSIDVSD